MKEQNEKIKEKQKVKIKLKGQRGITLIALVVTIIVLLILAGVSIAMLTGEGGIIKQAGEARERTGRANVIEQARVDLLEKQTETKGKVSKEDLYEVLNKYFENLPNLEDETWNNEETWKKKEVTGKNDKTVKVEIGELYNGSLANGEEGLKPGKKAEKTEKDNYVDENGDKATVPEGFKVSDARDEETQEYTEDKVADGLVVIAPDGSEFVWIPIDENLNVKGTEKKMAKLQDGSSTDYRGVVYYWQGEPEVEKEYGWVSTTYREPAYLDYGDATTYNQDEENNPIVTQEGLQEEYNAMINNVKTYGGFYVGRYETSISGETVASKSGQTPMSAEVTSGNMWYGMYDKQKKYASSNESLKDVVGSSMMWGSQYDAMLNYALQGNDAEKVIATNNGNHSGSQRNTGATPNDKILNIYDLEGNLNEWTLEAYSASYRVLRGGYYDYGCSARNRSIGITPKGINDSDSSRLALYIL